MRVLMLSWICMVLLFSDLFRINVMHALGQCLPDQKSELLQIRSQLSYNSSLSYKLVQWDERVDCCQWPGVSCNDAGYVTGLDLSHEPIDGGANASLLLKLPSLSVIMLDGVNFSAPFPDFFEDFRNLTVLSLAECNFTGTVPGKVFQVPTLQTIDLSNNKMLEGSLPEFPENGSLQSLTLYGTKFSGNLPQSIGNLRLLSHIDLTSCEFSGAIPASFIKLTNLVDLNLGGNYFSGWIPSFKLFKNLTNIDLSSNAFTGEISFSNWDSLHNLEYLDMHENSFSGPIPESLFLLPSLESLVLSRNRFSGQIIDLQNVTSQLTYLDLSNNNLEGSIPSFFFRLQNLTTLILQSNKFNGVVHLTRFRNPESIYFLDFSHNSLVVETSIRAEELPLLPQFRLLKLSSCSLQKFPNFLKNQSELQYLELSCNDISGEVPSWIWRIGNGKLQFLNLSHNHLTHMQEPKEYGSVQYLDLNSNMLSGQIPRPPPEIEYLDLSSNNFSIIPHDIGDEIPGVYFFSIAKNRVSGRIPTSWCHAAYLEVLDLSNNALQGTIPPCLVQNNSYLTVLDLKGNHLRGEIPQKFLHSCSLETLDLSQNLLEGQLPPSLANCRELKVLNLGNNRISDTFPCWLNKLWNLHILVLCSNRFHGSISCPKLGGNSSWPSLQVIDLSSNNFSGNLPAHLFLELKAIQVDRNGAHSKVEYLHFTSGKFATYYLDSISLFLKGQGYALEKFLYVFTSIDFSSNQFDGSIPESVGELKLLYLLNISHNALTSNIPPSLENLKALEALDLSFNKLTGNIPVQLEILTFLEFLNLSYNHLVGKIPQGKQFNTFDASSFMGNQELCGFQLNVSCGGIKKPASPLPTLEEKQSTYHGDIYISIALGFAAGLGGIFVPLLLSSKWRSYYNMKIDGILSKIFFQRGQGRRNNFR